RVGLLLDVGHDPRTGEVVIVVVAVVDGPPALHPLRHHVRIVLRVASVGDLPELDEGPAPDVAGIHHRTAAATLQDAVAIPELGGGTGEDQQTFEVLDVRLHFRDIPALSRAYVLGLAVRRREVRVELVDGEDVDAVSTGDHLAVPPEAASLYPVGRCV